MKSRKNAAFPLEEKLFSDALGTDATLSVGPEGNSYSANTWTGMMVHNVNTIVNSLGK